MKLISGWMALSYSRPATVRHLKCLMSSIVIALQQVRSDQGWIARPVGRRPQHIRNHRNWVFNIRSICKEQGPGTRNGPVVREGSNGQETSPAKVLKAIRAKRCGCNRESSFGVYILTCISPLHVFRVWFQSETVFGRMVSPRWVNFRHLPKSTSQLSFCMLEKGVEANCTCIREGCQALQHMGFIDVWFWIHDL